MSALELLVDALAAYRLTRLVTKDTITRPFRVAVYRRAYHPANGDEPLSDEFLEQAAWTDPHAPFAVELVHCRWCVGVWAAFGVVAARAIAPRAWSPVSRALACASAAALVAGLEKD